MIFNFGLLCLFVTGVGQFLIGFVSLVVLAPLSAAWTAISTRIDGYFERRVARRGYRLR